MAGGSRGQPGGRLSRHHASGTFGERRHRTSPALRTPSAHGHRHLRSLSRRHRQEDQVLLRRPGGRSRATRSTHRGGSGFGGPRPGAAAGREAPRAGLPDGDTHETRTRHEAVRRCRRQQQGVPRRLPRQSLGAGASCGDRCRGGKHAGSSRPVRQGPRGRQRRNDPGTRAGGRHARAGSRATRPHRLRPGSGGLDHRGGPGQRGGTASARRDRGLVGSACGTAHEDAARGCRWRRPVAARFSTGSGPRPALAAVPCAWRIPQPEGGRRGQQAAVDEHRRAL